MKALIHNNKIVQVEINSFKVHPDFTWVECPDDCNTRWEYKDGVCQPIIVPEDEIKKRKKQSNAAARYAKEISGVDYNGHLILTDREDINILNSAMEKIRRGLVDDIDWKCGDGSYLVLNSSNIAEIELIVLTHIQGSFAKEKYYNDLIDQGVDVNFVY